MGLGRLWSHAIVWLNPLWSNATGDRSPVEPCNCTDPHANHPMPPLTPAPPLGQTHMDSAIPPRQAPPLGQTQMYSAIPARHAPLPSRLGHSCWPIYKAKRLRAGAC